MRYRPTGARGNRDDKIPIDHFHLIVIVGTAIWVPLWSHLSPAMAASNTGSNAFIGGPSAEPLPLDLLQGKVQGERKYGYTKDGQKKRILLNAFDMNGVGHISLGQWQNPEDKSSQKNRLPYWIELAKLLEKGKFNALFLGKTEQLILPVPFQSAILIEDSRQLWIARHFQRKPRSSNPDGNAMAPL